MTGHEVIRQCTNHLWQSTVFAAVAALMTLAFRTSQARVRYWLWLSASLKFLLPFALLIGLGDRLWSTSASAPIATKLAPPRVSLAVQQIAQPFPGRLPGASSVPPTHTAHWIPEGMLSIWICGFAGVFLLRVRAWLHIRAAVRASTPVAMRAAVAVRSSPGWLEPGVAGIVHPVLLLPQDILRQFLPQQLEAVIAHELSHVRRRDNLTAALHMVVEAVFWFHPPVWWIGARLVEERERACDEAVLRMGSEPRDYADAILNVCKLYAESPVRCVSGISGADLKKRIVRILDCNVGSSLGAGRKLLLGAGALLAVALPVALGWAQVQTGVVTLVHAKDGVKHAFDVATIKPSQNGAQRVVMTSVSRVSMTGMSVSDMLRYAYGIKSDEQVEGAPGWLKTEHFDVEGKASAADVAAFNRLGFDGREILPRLQMQSLLEDRFQLKAKVEMRDLPVYALMVDRGGVKMKAVQAPAGASLSPPSAPPPPSPPPPPPGPPPLPGGAPNPITARGVSMPRFAEMLSHFYAVGNRSVVDETGLPGTYDFVLAGVSMMPPPAGGANTAEPSAPEVSLFTALREQLGLKLVPAKAPVEVLVIDRIEQPSPN